MAMLGTCFNLIIEESQVENLRDYLTNYWNLFLMRQYLQILPLNKNQKRSLKQHTGNFCYHLSIYFLILSNSHKINKNVVHFDTIDSKTLQSTVKNSFFSDRSRLWICCKNDLRCSKTLLLAELLMRLLINTFVLFALKEKENQYRATGTVFCTWLIFRVLCVEICML